MSIKVLNIMTSNLDYNGIGTSLLNYYKNIDSSKIQMDFLVPNKVDGKLKKKFTITNNNLFELEYKNKKMHQVRPLLYVIKLYKIIKKEKYDIVHVHGSSSLLFLQLLAAMLAGVKIRIAHSRNTNSDHNFLHTIFKPIFSILYTDCFACGKEAGEWLFGKNKDIFIIPNGKDIKMFSFKKDIRTEYRKKWMLDDKIVIGHIGNFNYQKNHEYLINIFNELIKMDKNYFLVLAGDGPLEKDIRKMVDDYDLKNNVLFLGQIPVEEVSKWLNAMDIMIFPSRFEGFPNVLIEWQISGLPCIISDTITQDVKVTELVKFLSLNNQFYDWAKEINSIHIEDRDKNNFKIQECVKKAGYDIKENSKRLERKYYELMQR